MKHNPTSVAAPVWLAGFALLVAACQHPQPDRTILRALICEECTSGESDSVLARGNSAIPMLLAAMTLPSSDLTRDVEDIARREFQLARNHSPSAIADSGRVLRRVVRFKVGYQMRAAYLLRRIGTPEAKHALGTALMSLPLRRYPGSLLPESRHFADSLWRTFP